MGCLCDSSHLSASSHMGLVQVTQLVVETETKVTKVESLIDEQDKLVEGFKVSFKETKDIMDGVADAPNAGLSMCTGKDICLWSLMMFMCCFSVICIQAAMTKWASLFGFSPTALVLESTP